MFGFFNSKEKKLKKLGYGAVVDSLKKQLKQKKITKSQYQETLSKWIADNYQALQNINHVEVSARQTFNEREVLPPLNLENITVEVVDIEYLQSQLYFNYKEKENISYTIVAEIVTYIKGKYNITEVSDEVIKTQQHLSDKELIRKVTNPITSENKTEILAGLFMLQQRKK